MDLCTAIWAAAALIVLTSPPGLALLIWLIVGALITVASR